MKDFLQRHASSVIGALSGFDRVLFRGTLRRLALSRKTRPLSIPSRRAIFLAARHLIHPQWGFMHVRVQTWLPFSVSVCINGRECLGRQMDATGLGYRRRENCFTNLENLEKAQALMDSQLTTIFELPGRLLVSSMPRKVRIGLSPSACALL